MDFSKHIQKAEEAFRQRNYDFAVELYQQLLELDPDQGEARSGLRRLSEAMPFSHAPFPSSAQYDRPSDPARCRR